MRCQECDKKTDVLAEGMCIDCYKNSPYYSVDSKESVLTRSKELENQLTDLLEKDEMAGIESIDDLKTGNIDPEKAVSLLRRAADKIEAKHMAIGTASLLLVGGVASGWWFMYQQPNYKATLVNDSVTTIEEQGETIEIDPNNREADTDGDRIPDYKEINKTNTDPAKADTDDDGLSDYEEIVEYKTDPLNPDTDSDTFPDGEEIIMGTDPLEPQE